MSNSAYITIDGQTISLPKDFTIEVPNFITPDECMQQFSNEFGKIIDSNEIKMLETIDNVVSGFKDQAGEQISAIIPEIELPMLPVAKGALKVVDVSVETFETIKSFPIDNVKQKFIDKMIPTINTQEVLNKLGSLVPDLISSASGEIVEIANEVIEDYGLVIV